MKKGWQCEGCNRFSESEPWKCPGCKKEICDGCFDTYAHCKVCTKILTKEALISKANSEGWEFDWI